MTTRTVLPLVLLALLVARTSSADPGILLLAHGGSAEWNARVTELVAKVNATRPAEVAFGMATRASIQSAIDKLVARGVTEIVAVPLFVSSWSTVITSTEYLLGLRAEAPTALANYARMSHSRALEYLTLSDDASKPVRDSATAQLRGIAQRELAAGRRVLIVPLLISFGGIERGLRERLDGLSYTMAESALMPDDRLVTWVLTIAAAP